jgi:Fe-S oxidoreductase
MVYDLFKEKKIRFKKSPEKITYHDPCRLGRKLHDLEIYDEPRELLTHSSLGLFEFSNSKRETNCCGAGAGVRGVESSIAISIGTQLLKEAKTDKLISSCPLCVFNYRYANYKSNLNKEVEYITTYLLENLDV